MLVYERAGRPKLAKLAVNLALREKVEKNLEKKYSPEQIVGRLLVEFPDDPEMPVSTETMYQSMYVQSRGALRRDLAVWLRTGRALRRPSRKVGQPKNRIPNMMELTRFGTHHGVHESGSIPHRVVNVAPGAIVTPISQFVLDDSEARHAVESEIPLARMGSPEDIAAAVAWLASDQAQNITGTTTIVDGGLSLYPKFV